MDITAKVSRKYVGTHPVRTLGHGTSGIWIPKNITGDFRIYVQSNGIIVLIPLGNPEKDIAWVF
jgi:hypothetical protein